MDNFYSAESSISSDDETDYDNAIDDIDEDEDKGDVDSLYSCILFA